MYCIQCGVKLQPGTENCPLCGLKIYHPDIKEEKGEALYPSDTITHSVLKPAGVQFIVTFLFALAGLTCLVLDLKLNQQVIWSGYVLFSLLLLYSLVAPSLWFSRPNPIFDGLGSFACLAGLLIYINAKTGGHWFLSFAFPCLMMAFVLTMGPIILNRYLPTEDARVRLYITAGWLVLLGGCLMLLEFFLSITFDIPMIWWSVYPMIPLGFLAAFLILTALWKSLRESLYKRFFV